MSRTYRKTSSYRLGRGEKFSKKLKDGSYTKAFHSCENNQGCPYCESNRLHKHRKKITLKEELKISKLSNDINL